MGKKMKLKLDDLEIQSFVTSKEEKGGWTGDTIGCCLPTLNDFCHTDNGAGCPSAHTDCADCISATDCGACPSVFCNGNNTLGPGCVRSCHDCL